MARPLSPIHAPIDMDAEYVGEGRNEICVCTHTLARHANPHLDQSRQFVLTERCLDCNDCKGFRMPKANLPPVPPPSTRLSRLAALDSRILAGNPRSLGPGGASAVYEQAVRKALVDEMADQLRGGTGESLSEIGKWAAEIIEAFSEEE